MIILTFCLLRSGRFFFFVSIVPAPFTSVCCGRLLPESVTGSIWSRQSVVKKENKEPKKKAQADINIYSSSKEREQHVKFGGFFTLYQGKKRTTPVSYI